MKTDAILSAVTGLSLLSCSASVSSDVAEASQTTAASAGAFADTARAPDPRVITPVRTPACDGDVEYCPSPDQVRVDRSFSPFAIDSPLSAAGSGLIEIIEDGCAQGEGCNWRDNAGVRHFNWGDTPAGRRIVLKTVEAAEFVGRPIDALGIGSARRQARVLANVRAFLPGVEIDCDPLHVSGNVGPVECGATLNPGWIQIGFDRDGNLLRVRFDGYQFT